MSELFKRIDTVFVKVTDIDQSIDWYVENLGFTVRWYDKEGGYAAIEVGETPITLVQDKEMIPAEHCLLNFYSNNLEEVHHQLKEKSVDTEAIEKYGAVSAFEFKDCDGNRFGVCYFAE